MRFASASALLLTATMLASSASATVLCVKNGKKGLKGAVIARAACNKKEKQIDATLGDQLGIRGERGAGISVKDQADNEIGIPVGSTYYGTATVAVELTPAGASAAQFFVVAADGNGLVKSDASNFEGSFWFTDAACTARNRTVPFDVDRTDPSHPKPTPRHDTLAPELVVDPTGATGYFIRNSEGQDFGVFGGSDQTRKIYRIFRLAAPTATQANDFCSGHLVGTPQPCTSDDGEPSGFFCANCCEETGGGVFLAPAHSVDLTSLKTTAPLRLSR